MNADQPRQGRWVLVWRRFRSDRLGVAGLVIAVFLLLVATLAPLLANDQPVLCRFDGKVYAPAMIDTIRNIPGASLVVQKRRPFRLATFDFKSEFNAARGDWAVWTLVPFGPREIVSPPLLPPSGLHWLGTDQSGRDVLSRMIHGAGVSMRVGFLSMGIAVSILIEAGLSWLGFGVQPPDSSWGTILRAGYENLFTAPHMIPPPCIAIFLAVLSFNLVADALRNVIDPRLQETRA